jgi:lipid-binding SYLF domain-containing protein
MRASWRHYRLRAGAAHAPQPTDARPRCAAVGYHALAGTCVAYAGLRRGSVQPGEGFMIDARAAFAAFCLAFTACAGLATPTVASAQSREEQRIATAAQVLADAQQMRDQQIPDWLLQRAQGIAIIPDVIKVGLGVGGRGGRGVLVVRMPDGSWSNPSFVTLAGGSFGWQAGVQASDIVLVFTTRQGIEGITGGKFTLGADASVAVGPVGRQVSGATDVTLDAEVYSYSRAEGLFGGIAIDGTVISIDHRANAAFYGRPGILASEIFGPNPPAAPASADALRAQLAGLGGAQTAAPVGAGTSPGHAGAGHAAGTAGAAAPEQPGLESGAAATFPLDAEPTTNPPPQ